MEAIKKGSRVYVIRGTNVERGVVTSSSREFSTPLGITYRVRWGEGSWGGTGSFDAGEVYRLEDDACLALANRLNRIAACLVYRAEQAKRVCDARRRNLAAAGIITSVATKE